MPLLIFFTAVLGVSYLLAKAEVFAGFNVSKAQLDKIHLFYTNYFSYYNLLDARGKRRFLLRVTNIRKTKELHISKEIKNTSEEVELLVCAAFAQITFGYEEYEIESFQQIIVNPGEFYSRLANHQVKGLTLGSGYIYLSWDDFLKGYISPSDKINLALHELAHALYIDRFHYDEHYDWILWKEQALAILKELRDNPDKQFFREYGKTNAYEFWAVCVETFFEDPISFRSLYPDLYRSTARVLKQDMALRIMPEEKSEPDFDD